MFWMKAKTKKALEANGLIHDAIVMGVADKYIADEKLERDDFGLQLLGRALNWAIPNLNYDFGDDISKVEKKEFRERLQQDDNQIFKKGLAILNSDPLLDKLVTFFVVYEIHLVNNLFPKDGERRYTGMVRMNKFLAQTLEQEPNIQSPNFKQQYKDLFIEFNNVYGQYGKIMKPKTIDTMFSLL